MVQRLEEIVAKALKQVDGDTYLLAVIVAKRAERLSDGAESFLTKEFIQMKSLVKKTDIALYELAENKLDFKIS